MKAHLGSWPALLLVGGMVFAPLILLIRVSLYEPATGNGFYTKGTVTFANFASLSDANGLALLRFTLLYACAVVAGTLAIGYPLALWIRNLSRFPQLLALTLVLVPKTAGLLATLFGLQRLLPRGLFAAIFAEMYLVLPYVVLVLVVQIRSIPHELTSASHGLGATSWQTFRRVTWPLSRPGVLLAVELSFLWGLSAFLGPLFLGGPEETTLAVEIHRQAFEYGRWPRAAAHGVGLLVVSILVLVIISLTRRASR